MYKYENVLIIIFAFSGDSFTIKFVVIQVKNDYLSLCSSEIYSDFILVHYETYDLVVAPQ